MSDRGEWPNRVPVWKRRIGLPTHGKYDLDVVVVVFERGVAEFPDLFERSAFGIER